MEAVLNTTGSTRSEGGQMATSTKYAAALAAARLNQASGPRTVRSAVQGGANCGTKAIPGASFTWMWYGNPERLMSQSERLPS